MRRIVIEIKPHEDGKHCGDCPRRLTREFYGGTSAEWCGAFGKELNFRYSEQDWVFIRLPECIEAEIAKEPTNDR